MLDEGYWYGKGWPLLQGALINLAVHEAPDFLAQIAGGADTEAASRAYLAVLLAAVAARQSRAQPGMWSFALSLFANTDSFVHRVRRDQEALRGLKPGSDGEPLSPKRALGQLMRFFLNDALTQLGGDAHQTKVWLRIKAASDRIAKKAAQNGRPLEEGTRCGKAHLHQVLDSLGSDFPSDHSLPRTFETLEWYFGRFCDDCVQFGAGNLEILWLARDTGFLPDIDDCLTKLAQHERPLAEAFAAKFGLAFGNVRFLSARAYQTAQGIARSEFERLVEKGLPLLRRCVELAVNRASERDAGGGDK